MVYIVGSHKSANRRLAIITEDGQEQYDQPQVDLSYLQAMGPEAESGEAKASNKNVRTSNPEAAIELFTAAVGECDVVLDLINNLEQLRHLDYRSLSNKPKSAQAAMQHMTSSHMMRAARQRDALKGVAQRLRAGAQALRLVANQDNAFHNQVAQLQHYWAIRRTPAGSALGPDAPYLLDLSLGHVSNIQGVVPRAVTAANAAAAETDTKRSTFSSLTESFSAIPLIRGPHGQLRVQLPRQQLPLQVHALLAAASGSAATVKEEPGETDAKPKEGGGVTGVSNSVGVVGVGAAGGGARKEVEVRQGLQDAHKALLNCQQQLMWALIMDTLDQESLHIMASGGPNFTSRLVCLLTGLLAQQPELSDAFLASLRPVLLEHVLSCRLPPSLIFSSQRPVSQAHTASQHRMLHDVIAIVSHVCSRAGVWSTLMQQVVSQPGVSLHWVPSSRLCSSGVLVRFGCMDRCLVMVQDASVEIDGVLKSTKGGTRWGGEGHTSVTRHELPHLLPVVILGNPLAISTGSLVL